MIRSIRPLSWLACALACSTPLAQAADLNTLQLLTQGEFRLLSEDLGAAVSFKPMIPAESMGITGFDIGVTVTGTKLQNRDVWRKAAAGADVPQYLPVPTIRVHKGLPLNIDIGASYSQIPSTNIRVIGGELRWAVLPGSTVLPAVAIRGSLSSLEGVDQLKLRTAGVDISVSKGFAFVTPYAGIGTVRVNATPDGSTGKAKESFSQGKVFAGVNINLGLTNLLFEADKTGDATSYGAKVGFRF
jgi:hypothetical protein